MADDTIQLNEHQVLRVVGSTRDRLELEATWEAGSSSPPMHWHPSQHEHFEVVEGELTVQLTGEDVRVLRAGDVLDVPPRTGHRMWNGGSARARASWVVTPALRTEEMFRRMAGASRLKQGATILQHRAEFRFGDSPDASP